MRSRGPGNEDGGPQERFAPGLANSLGGPVLPFTNLQLILIQNNLIRYKYEIKCNTTTMQGI